MRKLRALALAIIHYLKGLSEIMAMLFACRVVAGKTDFDAVPAKLKQQVADIIVNDLALPEIVPAVFGGKLTV